MLVSSQQPAAMWIREQTEEQIAHYNLHAFTYPQQSLLCYPIKPNKDLRFYLLNHRFTLIQPGSYEANITVIHSVKPTTAIDLLLPSEFPPTQCSSIKGYSVRKKMTDLGL